MSRTKNTRPQKALYFSIDEDLYGELEKYAYHVRKSKRQVITEYLVELKVNNEYLDRKEVQNHIGEQPQ
jgi:hypothetical protein